MKYYVEVISMQVDNIVTRHLHHGKCIALQNAHFHEGKKVPKYSLKSTIFHQLLDSILKEFWIQNFNWFSNHRGSIPSNKCNAICPLMYNSGYHFVQTLPQRNKSDLLNFELTEEQDLTHLGKLQVPGGTCLGGGHLPTPD